MSDFVPPGDMPDFTSLMYKDETLIWWGKPDPMRYAVHGAAGEIIVGLVLSIMGIFMMSQVSGANTIWSMLFLSVFVACSLLVFYVPVRRYREASSTSYVLTDRRVIIASPSALSFHSLESIHTIDVHTFDHDRGKVLFFDQERTSAEGPNYFTREGFIGIADAEKVGREMHRLRSAT